MAITPTGAPVWVKINDHATYGGRTDKRNFAGKSSVNAQTDLSAEEWVRACADLGAVSRTAALATITYTADDTGSADPSIDNIVSMVAAPTATRVSDGVTRLTWASSYTDEYGVSGSVNIIGVNVTVHGTSAAVGTFNLEDPDADGNNERIRITIFDASGVVTDATVSVTVYTGPA